MSNNGMGKLDEEKLRRLHRLASVGTLSASLAHEIRNALVAGKTFIDLLLEKHQDAELAGIVRREMGQSTANAAPERASGQSVLERPSRP